LAGAPQVLRLVSARPEINHRPSRRTASTTSVPQWSTLPSIRNSYGA
jgi:hypothetical protein